MRCPRCGADNLSVIDSRGDGDAIRRRRECEGCQLRFNTYERVELALPMVVKKDGRREPFARAKIRAGLVRACEKTAVSMDHIEKIVESVEAAVCENFAKEISSRDLGEQVMLALKISDKVAYVRFASVYREFSDISQFIETLQGLKQTQKVNSRRRLLKRRKPATASL